VPFAALDAHPTTGETPLAHSRAVLDREVTGRTAAILTELEAIGDRIADGRPVTAEEVLRAADRIEALRVTIVYNGVLDHAV
jgi:hypothetical protein